MPFHVEPTIDAKSKRILFNRETAQAGGRGLQISMPFHVDRIGDAKAKRNFFNRETVQAGRRYVYNVTVPKKGAMASNSVVNRAVKAIDWDFLARAVVSEEGKRELSSLRRTYDDVSNTLETKLNQKPVSINWEMYKEKLPPKIVDLFKQSYESVKIPEYVDNFTPDFEKKHAELVAKATKDEEFSKTELVRLQGELDKVRAQKDALKTQTVDDYLERNPKLKEKFDEEIKSQNWGY